MQWIKQILRSNRFTAQFLELYFLSNKYLASKGWLESAFLFQSIDAQKKPIPWFTYPAIHFLAQKIKNKELSVFEHGSGNSTLWLADRAKNIVSVEHDAGFYAYMQPTLGTRSNVVCELREDPVRYAQKVSEYTQAFDIVIIDGIERVACAKNSLGALKPGGIIIWDNSDRDMYAEGYQFLADHHFKKIEFAGLGPIAHAETQTTIFYRTENCFGI